jgi:glycosyltransferase involved in cell wall biosynthesis
MKFLIVTPSFNDSKNLRDSIYSVLSQKGNFVIEHIIVDCNSSDQTVGILKRLELDLQNCRKIYNCSAYTLRWISEYDYGMYDAIIKGFNMSTGDIMAWINSDDLYQEGAFNEVYNIFKTNKNVLWVKGITDYIDESEIKSYGHLNKYNQNFIKKGLYGTIGPFIQQAGVFWRRELWNRIDHTEIVNYQLAGDFRLWQLFAEKTYLYSFDKHTSIFRRRKGQKSRNKDKYLKEAKKTVNINYLEKIFYYFIFKSQKSLDKLKRKQSRLINLLKN